jgi:hypothetical protein
VKGTATSAQRGRGRFQSGPAHQDGEVPSECFGLGTDLFVDMEHAE